MGQNSHDKSIAERADRVLGYLNFSSGAEDPSMLAQLNELCQWLDECEASQNGEFPLYRRLGECLQQNLDQASQRNRALKDSQQAKQVLSIAFDQVLPGYLDHHRDLLFHRTDESIFNAFFVGRVFELILQFSEYWDDPAETSRKVIGNLNDYIGHRPVAVLESRKLEPYEHEWVRPIPLYIRGAGVVHGPFRDVINSAIGNLRETDAEILRAAQFDLELLDELALDPRSFDFDHPVNKRPNYHFGQWDDRHIDNRGQYRRFVIHSVTLNALCSRVETETGIPREEVIDEAGAVLACTILMSAGICGFGPGAHDSTISLGNLLPVIAGYRDAFYDRLLQRASPRHRKRLQEEARIRQQPYGAARQHLNRQLADYRAEQMVHVHLSRIYARMGYPDAAIRQANALPVASTRMMCQIECLLNSGMRALEANDLSNACQTLPRLTDLLQRSIECGAVIDPWNIIGFDANYNLFQGTENTVRDHRADELIDLMEQLFCFAASIWISARAASQVKIAERVEFEFREMVEWWYQFATHEISSVDSFDAHEIYEATRNVADLLGQWNQSGGQQGNLEFWAGNASGFGSDRDYILAINSLIDRNDFDTSMALLIHWLSHDEWPSRSHASSAFHGMTGNWISQQRQNLAEQNDTAEWTGMAGNIWRRLCKFNDYVEANAGPMWDIPQFTIETTRIDDHPENAPASDSPDNESDDDLYRAAYEGMVFRETSDDGFEGSIYDDGNPTEESLQIELDRILEHLKFLDSVVACWGEAALLANEIRQNGTPGNIEKLQPPVIQKSGEWFRQANRYCIDLNRLIRSIEGFQLPVPDGSINSLAEYDRQRLFKETLLDQVIQLSVDTSVAMRVLGGVSQSLNQAEGQTSTAPKDDVADTGDTESVLWMETLAALMSRDRVMARDRLKQLTKLLIDLPLLYVPLSRGGDPGKIVQVRVRQSMIGQLLDCLPRLGLLTETRDMIHTALTMEKSQSVRQGAVTEFDELFRIGYTAMVDALIRASAESGSDSSSTQASDSASELPGDDGSGTELFDSLETLAETMLMLWLAHSQTLRLSVLEKVRDDTSWDSLVEFIEKFGELVFTQQFLNLSNIRAILHQGVENWLIQLEEEPGDEPGSGIVEKIQAGYSRRDAVRFLTLVLEAVIENFNEYRDYNCTTTQSDDGRLLFIFLDFLRLRCRYDQVCWNLRPIMWAHESLVRQNHGQVARLWRRLLAERVGPEAERLLGQLDELQDNYSIQLATVTQRLNERFIHPMHVDRLVSQVTTAMRDPDSEESQTAFELIGRYAESLAKMPVGAGLELPSWLFSLESEVEGNLSSAHESDATGALIDYDLPGLGDLRDQLDQMPRRES